MSTFYYIFPFAVFAAVALGFFLASAKGAMPAPTNMDVDRFMDAIACVENTPNSSVGLAGERSKYQITSGVWLAHSSKPFEMASEETESAVREVRRVMRAHTAWIQARLHGLHLEGSTVYQAALVYKAGYGRCLAKKVRPQDADYAERCKNIYFDDAS
jgi:hypothetical protein